MKKSTVRVYDTISKEYVDIEVSEEVYTYYNRSQWNMDDNDDSFYKHEIQFSALIGGNDGTFENFREFRIENSVEKEVISKLFTEKLYKIKGYQIPDFFPYTSERRQKSNFMYLEN